MTISVRAKPQKQSFVATPRKCKAAGNFEVFDELFADDFLDHTPQPGRTPDKERRATALQNPPGRISRLSRRDPLAARRWRPRDDVQDLSRDAPGRVPGRGADWPRNSIRDGRRHAGARRQDHRTLGRGQSLLPHAAARRLARAGNGRQLLPPRARQLSNLKGTSHDHRHHWIGRHRHRLRTDAGPRRHRGDHLQQPRARLAKELVRELGPSIKAGTREEAARADIVFVAVNWTKLPAALAGFRNGTAALSSTPTIRSRRRCSSRSIWRAGCRVRFCRSCAGSARREGVQSPSR